MKDEDLMPWGIHKGVKMANVPASYLLFMYEQNKCCLKVKKYIENNLNVLKQETKNEKSNN